jgi:hypothetical protein
VIVVVIGTLRHPGTGSRVDEATPPPG